MVHVLGRNKIPTPWVVHVLDRNKIPTPWVVNLTNFLLLLRKFSVKLSSVWSISRIFRHFNEFFGVFTKILKFREINYVFAIVCIWISFVSVLVLLLKFIRIGLLTNRLGRNKIPYHLGNYSFPCGFAARERIISLVVRNFIPTRAIGEEFYITKSDKIQRNKKRIFVKIRCYTTKFAVVKINSKINNSWQHWPSNTLNWRNFLRILSNTLLKF